MSCIYVLKNKINGKTYVGQTTQKFEKRLSNHLYEVKHFKKNTPFHNAIRKYGIENFTVKIIPCPVEMLDWMERTIIQDLKDFGNNKLYNIIDGGYNSPMKNKEVVKKQSESMKKLYQNGLTPWNKGKVGLPQKGKPIILTHPNGKEERFEKIKDVEIKYNLTHSNISRVAKNKQKHCHGFTCRYAED